MRIILIIILGLCFIYLGYQIKVYYVKRQKFYCALVTFINTLSSEISFLKTDLSSVINSRKYYIYLDEVLKGYIDNKEISVVFLTKEENVQIKEFLDSIGKQDVDGELNNLNYYLQIFNNKKEQSKIDTSAKGVLMYKLVSLLGVVLCILFM